jgi:hypothetical protein
MNQPGEAADSCANAGSWWSACMFILRRTRPVWRNSVLRLVQTRWTVSLVANGLIGRKDDGLVCLRKVNSEIDSVANVV